MELDNRINIESFAFYRRLAQEVSLGKDATLAIVVACGPPNPVQAGSAGVGDIKCPGPANAGRGIRAGSAGTEDVSRPDGVGQESGIDRSLVGAKFVLREQEVIDRVNPLTKGVIPSGSTSCTLKNQELERELESVILKASQLESPPWRDGTRLAAVKFEGVEMKVYMERLNKGPEVVVLGGGHVSRALVPLMKTLGFRVTVVDDRPDFACRASFPNADCLIVKGFLEALNGIELGSQSYVVIVTRGHQYDQECLEAVLRKPVAYVGMIGSRRKIEGSFSLAKNRGFTSEDLRRVYAPIGIDIGAQTPEEIAVCIAAEIIKVRRGGRAASLSDARRQNGISVSSVTQSGDSSNDVSSVCPAQEPPLESVRAAAPGLLKDFLGDLEHPFAMAVVVAARGSTPRRPGAKMLVFSDGSIKGTIGGGSGEALVKQEALDVISSMKPRLVEVDLTGHYLEAFSDDRGKAGEGTRDAQGVCGGSMEVFVERLSPGE